MQNLHYSLNQNVINLSIFDNFKIVVFAYYNVICEHILFVTHVHRDVLFAFVQVAIVDYWLLIVNWNFYPVTINIFYFALKYDYLMLNVKWGS